MDDSKNQMATLYVELENILARIVHYANGNALLSICEKIMLPSETTRLDIDIENISCVGYDKILGKIKDLNKDRAKNETKEVSLWASPRYEANLENKTSRALCDIFTYRIGKKNKADQYECELIISQLIIDTIYYNGEIKITNLHWRSIQSMKPWVYDGLFDIGEFIGYGANTLPQKDKSSLEAVKIRNLQNKFFHCRLHGIKDLFSDVSSTSLFIETLSKEMIIGKDKIAKQADKWVDQELENGGFYKFFGITSVPLIEVAYDELTAKGTFMVEIFQFDKYSNSYNQDEGYHTVHTICRMDSNYICENEIWKIRDLHIKKIVELPIENYLSGYRYDHMTGEPNSWYEQSQKLIGNFPVDMYLIQNVVNKWGYYCRCGKLAEFYNSYMKNDSFNCRMYFKSQGGKSKPVKTETEIIERLSGMDERFTPLMYSYHTATTPEIEIDETGLFAVGKWYDRSATNLLSQAESKDSIPYMALLTKYIHRFRKISGKWHMIDFFAEPIISLPDWELNALTSKGYISQENALDLPNPYLI